MNRPEWDQICQEVRDQMAQYTWPLVTPIAQSLDDLRANAFGTGNYVRLHDNTYLLTNEHVVRQAVGSHLAHLPGPTDDYVACYNACIAAPWPLDIAITRLGEEWSTATQRHLSASCFAAEFAPEENELFFWLGFPGSTAMRFEPVTELNIRYNWFGQPLQTAGIPLLTQAVPNSPLTLEGYDPEKHVVLHYPARATREAGRPEVDAPNPQGMSGSLLWDTRFVANMRAGRPWGPDSAKVCGLIWAAHSRPEVVVATRIEHLRPALLSFLREEAAYFHWIDRGKPLWDSVTDWIWAEHAITGLD